MADTTSGSAASLAGGGGGKRRCSVSERVQLHMATLALQFGYVGFHIVSRAALNMGMNKLIFLVYRNIIAFLLLLPFAYFLEKKERPAITLSFLLRIFLLALVGITTNQGFYLLALDNTSPTFASAIQNSAPAITFLMAAILRIEQVRLNRKNRVAKVAGTVLCVAGATVITLYKGPTIESPAPPLHQTTPLFLALGDAKSKNWTLGCIYLIGHCLSWSGWLVLQAPVLKKYPMSYPSNSCKSRWLFYPARFI
ncbi:protein WALLS ARE THIN 1-like [Malania oleifera]|uniref:protein WALLS ARE THIN 1-like n=1 Tax=Malania oleifera TaxID=397392 RepID=UPI0025AE3E22|nr:protein WALLS ARE THIN 1-like [Malania oleifera]